MSRNKYLEVAKARFIQLINSVWLFPVCLLLAVLMLTGFKISGTSVGVYNGFLYGESKPDPDLLFGEPRGIRSDEWLFMTQLTAAQSESGFPRFNENIGSTGRDMSVIIDVPYREWSVLFKPQNLIFFILPLEHAFAFKWWLLITLLATSLYFLLLRLFKHNRLLSAILATAATFSPFIIWWYQTATVAPVFYGIFLIILTYRIIDSQTIPYIKSRALTSLIYVALLVYLLTAFALIQYPPFQIPIALVVAVIVLGKFLNSFIEHKHSIKSIMPSIAIFAAGGAIAGILVGVFLFTRLDAIKDVAGTVYPGSRIIQSGGLKKYYLFDGFLMPQLQDSTKGASFFNNQSEASNFILLLPFLLIPGFYMTYKDVRNKTTDWVFIGLQFIGVLFMSRMFIPGGNKLYSLLFLDKVPNERLLIGLGFTGLIHTFFIIKKVTPIGPRYNRKHFSVIIYTLLCFGIMALTGWRAKTAYPNFIANEIKIVLLAGAVAVIIYCILTGRKLIGALTLLAFSLSSVILIHPLYKGLGFVSNNPISNTIARKSEPDEVWAVSSDMVFENVAVLRDRDSLSGVQFYPDVTLWRQLGGDKNDLIYNRYAHVLFEAQPTLPESIRLLQPDLFIVQLNCGGFIRENVDFVISSRVLDLGCAHKIETLHFPLKDFHFYKLQ